MGKMITKGAIRTFGKSVAKSKYENFQNFGKTSAPARKQKREQATTEDIDVLCQGSFVWSLLMLFLGV
jgi:hypothetical protein